MNCSSDLVASHFDNYMSGTLDKNMKLKMNKDKSDLPSNASYKDECKNAINVQTSLMPQFWIHHC